ncbi:alpha/beta hydrolase-fold protein [Planctomicrobium sp. SH664]|uniref:alpha/beta hydrolase-fold protein n=1 Tax=Planctomicrobium sp. SH664 TaxID=3448125 RepID=UPI003F5CA95B
MFRHIPLCLLRLLLVLSFGTMPALAADDRSFGVQSDPAVHSEPLTGQFFVFFSKVNRRGASHGEAPEPRFGPSWFDPQPFLSLDVENWQPGTSLTFDLLGPNVRRFPQSLTAKDLNGLLAQVVFRQNPDERQIGAGPGNLYGPVLAVPPSETVALMLDGVVPEPVVKSSEWLKPLRVRSELISSFRRRNTDLTGYVRLPPSYYRDQGRRYPVVLEVPGFGWSHSHLGEYTGPNQPSNTLGVEFIHVTLDPNCRLGHHVFANSANNGPYGDALVRELIPALDQEFRTTGRPETRFLTGHSSGGWSTLWLQVNYPDDFGGVWSTAPDPVDFTDFQRIDLSAPRANMFVDPQGKRRPLARMNGSVLVWYDTFSRMEDVLGDGGQLHSFEAVFSPRGDNGQPLPLWNRSTGEVDPVVAEAWKKYDIRLLLEQNWPQLGPKLRGKLHIYMGLEDTFYLEGAVQKLKASQQRLGSDAEIELIAGRNHFDLVHGGLDKRIEQEMAAQTLNVQPSILQNRAP